MEGTSPSKDESKLSNECAITLAVGGMTCVACVRAITDAVSEIEGVSDVVVNQLGKSASAMVASPELIPSVVTLIEDIGYECTVISVTPTAEATSAARRGHTQRTVALQLAGLDYIPPTVVEALQKHRDVSILEPHISDPSNVMRIQYTPSPPHLTIRSIIASLCSTRLLVSDPRVEVWHPPSSVEVAQRMYQKEQRDLLLRLIVAVIAVIPIFIIGIVYMSLLKAGSLGRKYFETPIWAGHVTRGEWALFLASTPVMFYAAEGFHRRSLQELWHLWRPGSRASWPTRFLRFGSMNLLISLGVSVAYFSSVAQLAISAIRDSSSAPRDVQSMTYFDSVAFLTMFLLIGRFIEAFSKHQAASAVSLLGQLRTTEAFLVTPKVTSSASSETSTVTPHHSEAANITPISVDLLEVGDIVRVPPGATPPADGTIVSLESTSFDESSLTGESRNVPKCPGDQVFVGSINKMRSVDVRVDAVEGETMLDQVIEAVGQGQTKRAPIERIVDVITAHFVPVITALAIITWVIWLSLGLSGTLPSSTLDGSVGGWAFWSLEFAISVFVIACPCGIGLAAPTALLVGSGLAAKFGILARGGGEAFQEAAQVDVVVFDKTGTLTEGTEPKVTHTTISSLFSTLDDRFPLGDDFNSMVANIVLQLASASSHPLCLALRGHFKGSAETRDGVLVAASNVDEHPGCGMRGSFTIETTRGGEIIEAIAYLGSETWLKEKDVSSEHYDAVHIHALRSEGKSVVLLALELPAKQASSLVATFAVSDPIRREAQSVIAHLHTLGIETWMISGDSQVTAHAVATSVGITKANVIAGVLPHQKADKIRWLQSLPKEVKKGKQYGRKIVAMVGDGINDAPALTAADIGVAMGSGSDIALSSAKFVLLSSDLNTLLILVDLSKKVFRRIKFNFAWALVYNLIAIPIAAGVIYPAGHTRLSPVWSSLAMALSSTSVVCSSLLLRRYQKPSLSDSTGRVTSPTRESAKEIA